MKEILSLSNSLIKTTAQLHNSQSRVEQNSFLAEGVRTIQTLIEAGVSIEALFCADLSLLPRKLESIQVYKVTPSILKKLSGAHSPSGLIARITMPTPQKPTNKRALILYNLHDPGNVGTLIRSAIACGIADIITIGGADPFSYKSVQASAGTIGYARISKLVWHEVVDIKKGSLIALTPRDGNSPHFREDGWFIVGSEAHGLPKEIIEQCDEQLTLSMPGSAESFNAAIAGSIALYISCVPL